jgi:hypothetical protein
MEKYLITDSPLIKKKIFWTNFLSNFLLKGNFLFLGGSLFFLTQFLGDRPPSKKFLVYFLQFIIEIFFTRNNLKVKFFDKIKTRD